MTGIETRLHDLRIQLPAATSPVANFVPCVQVGDLLFISGQISSENGRLGYSGKVGRELPLAQAREAARLCALNILAQAQSFLGRLDRVQRVCQLQVFVNAVPEFTEHSTVGNGASDLLVEVFGDSVGAHARFAVGVSSLPFNAAVEVAAVLAVA
jgi:enamine deaminase RidA (YjgF/YER057c/UK114 family)